LRSTRELEGSWNEMTWPAPRELRAPDGSILKVLVLWA